MLNRRRVLVAEDEPFIARALALAVEDADGEVVGPVASVAEGLAVLSREPSTPRSWMCASPTATSPPSPGPCWREAKVVVFHTGSAVPGEITEQFGNVAVCPKPMPSERVVNRLAALVGGRDEAGF